MSKIVELQNEIDADGLDSDGSIVSITFSAFEKEMVKEKLINLTDMNNYNDEEGSVFTPAAMSSALSLKAARKKEKRAIKLAERAAAKEKEQNNPILDKALNVVTKVGKSLRGIREYPTWQTLEDFRLYVKFEPIFFTKRLNEVIGEFRKDYQNLPEIDIINKHKNYFVTCFPGYIRESYFAMMTKVEPQLDFQRPVTKEQHELLLKQKDKRKEMVHTVKTLKPKPKQSDGKIEDMKPYSTPGSTAINPFVPKKPKLVNANLREVYNENGEKVFLEDIKVHESSMTFAEIVAGASKEATKQSQKLEWLGFKVDSIPEFVPGHLVPQEADKEVYTDLLINPFDPITEKDYYDLWQQVDNPEAHRLLLLNYADSLPDSDSEIEVECVTPVARIDDKDALASLNPTPTIEVPARQQTSHKRKTSIMTVSDVEDIGLSDIRSLSPISSRVKNTPPVPKSSPVKKVSPKIQTSPLPSQSKGKGKMQSNLPPVLQPPVKSAFQLAMEEDADSGSDTEYIN